MFARFNIAAPLLCFSLITDVMAQAVPFQLPKEGPIVDEDHMVDYYPALFARCSRPDGDKLTLFAFNGSYGVITRDFKSEGMLVRVGPLTARRVSLFGEEQHNRDRRKNTVGILDSLSGRLDIHSEQAFSCRVVKLLKDPLPSINRHATVWQYSCRLGGEDYVFITDIEEDSVKLNWRGKEHALGWGVSAGTGIPGRIYGLKVDGSHFAFHVRRHLFGVRAWTAEEHERWLQEDDSYEKDKIGSTSYGRCKLTTSSR